MKFPNENLNSVCMLHENRSHDADVGEVPWDSSADEQ